MIDLLSFGSSIDRLRLFSKEYGKPAACICTEENTKMKKNTRASGQATGRRHQLIYDG
jgi:hypothetical protein